MDRREAVLEATLNLVTERGLYDTPMSEVAKKAGVAAGGPRPSVGQPESTYVPIG